MLYLYFTITKTVNTTEAFVKQKLPDFLRKVEKDDIGKDITELNVYEKTLIYYYSIEGYLQLNEDLRDSKENEYEWHLSQALGKLPNYVGVVYRGCELSSWEIDRYRKAEIDDTEVIDLAFMSCSTSKPVAHQFSKGSTIFRIISKTGKSVVQLSFHVNEKEILFQSKCKFKVTEIDDSGNLTTITLREI